MSPTREELYKILVVNIFMFIFTYIFRRLGLLSFDWGMVVTHMPIDTLVRWLTASMLICIYILIKKED